MEKIIKAAVDRGASDLHIKAGDVFRARIDGRLVPLTRQALTADQTRAIALGLLPTDVRDSVGSTNASNGAATRAIPYPTAPCTSALITITRPAAMIMRSLVR